MVYQKYSRKQVFCHCGRFKSLHSNIDHEEGAQACFKKLEERKYKSIPSIAIKNLILVILLSNAFRFDNEYYRQITSTAMGTPMSPNYANLFMDNFQQSLLRDYSQKTGSSPSVWFRFIDDIFLIWTGNRTRWIISFPLHRITINPTTWNLKLNSIFISPLTKFIILIKVPLKHGKLRTTLFTKPADSHFYLMSPSITL